MIRGTGVRTLALASCLGVLFGCGGDDDGGGGTGGVPRTASGAEILFLDDFSGTFPSPNWNRRSGNPFVSPNVGNAAPGLALITFGSACRVRSKFEFSTDEPVTVSFELSSPELHENSRFKFRVLGGDGADDASFEVDVDDGHIELEIDDSEADVGFAPHIEYRTVEFSVDGSGTAQWRIDGQVLHSRANFRGGSCRVEVEVTGLFGTKFVVDNVMITRP